MVRQAFLEEVANSYHTHMYMNRVLDQDTFCFNVYSIIRFCLCVLLVTTSLYFMQVFLMVACAVFLAGSVLEDFFHNLFSRHDGCNGSDA